MQSLGYSLFMMGLVLAAIPISLWLGKRIFRMRAGTLADRPLEILAQLPLGPRERVVLLRVQDQVMVLGATAQQVNLLGQAELPLATPAQAQPGFTALLDRARSRMEAQR